MPKFKNYEELPLHDKLLNKVQAYGQTIWRDKWKEGVDKEWLDNFKDIDEDKSEREKINMLFLLSKFMYFGNNELRQLLISLYRDLFKYPIIASIRKRNSDSIDFKTINEEFQLELNASRFLGVGNPSESGVHMLYYFRQECKLSKEYFINISDIFTTSKITEKPPNENERTFLKTEIKDKNIKRYIFIDDFCGSGSQATEYLKKAVENMKFENPNIEVNYLMLFGTEHGIKNIRDLRIFNIVEAVFTIDETFKTFSENSRYFSFTPDQCINRIFSKETALKYGTNLFSPPLGHGNCELLLALYHNTPDNSLPIFWSERNNWKPVFKRYNKIY